MQISSNFQYPELTNYEQTSKIIPTVMNIDKTDDSYGYLIKNLDPHLLQKRLSRVPDLATHTQELCSALSRGDWQDPIFKEKELFPLYGMAALLEGKIEVADFSTLMIYWSILQHHTPEEITTIKLFQPDGSINQQAVEIIQQTLKFPQNNYKSFLHKKQLDQFIERMKSLPVQQQQFWHVADKQSEMADISPSSLDYILGKGSISLLIKDVGQINIFARFSLDGQKLRMMPSFGMMQEFLRSYRGENGVTIRPVIGLSSNEDIENNGLTGTRDMALPFIEMISDEGVSSRESTTLPQEADLIACPQIYDVIYHDFYHAIAASNVPSRHQKAFILIAQIFKETMMKEEYKACKSMLNEYYERLIDMECSPYRHVPPFAINDYTFWKCIGNLRNNAKVRKATKIARKMAKAELNASHRNSLTAEEYATISQISYKKANEKFYQPALKHKLLNHISEVIIERKEKIGVELNGLEDIASNIHYSTMHSPYTERHLNLILNLERVINKARRSEARRLW